MPDNPCVLTLDAEAGSGLDKIYIVRNSASMEVRFSSDANQVSVSSFGSQGAHHSTPVPHTVPVNGIYQFQLLPSDAGYIISEDDKSTYFWLINYDSHRSTVSDLSVSPESDCDVDVLITEGAAPAIRYYTIMGASKELSRDILVSYHTLVFNEESSKYIQSETSVSLAYIDGAVRVPAPLCDTEFTMSSDRFMRFFGENQIFTTSYVSAKKVEAHVSAHRLSDSYPNEIPDNSDSEFSGSAPLDISFIACVSDATAFTEWQVTQDPHFDNVELRFPMTEFAHTFSQEGQFYVRFVAADNSGECVFESEVFTVSIGSSSLECPNAFSPTSSSGVNDEWKVAYKSIISFECHIFNRWGTELAVLTHPSQGWDGKYNGKYVPTGVYFYVITATGADGKKYNLSGDINVINNKTSQVN